MPRGCGGDVVKLNHRTRMRLRAQATVFQFLFFGIIGVVAYLSTQYEFRADWTVNNRNSLSEASRNLLLTLDAPITITAYARPDESLRSVISKVIEKYQAVYSDMSLEFVNPDLAPDRVRELGVRVDGELVIEYQLRTENVRRPTEYNITNALQRLVRKGERWVVFVAGHGERSPHGKANHDYGDFGRELERKGFLLQQVNVAARESFPDNTALVVIAGAQVDYLPGEVDTLRDYLVAGGNLLWLTDPGMQRGLEILAEYLGVEIADGALVDANTQLFGIDDPTMILVAEYPNTKLTTNFELMTVFPRATALDFLGGRQFTAQPFLITLPRSWLETGVLEGDISYEPASGDREGPLVIGWLLERESGNDENPVQQRIVVIGDGDFLANSYLANGGNLDLGLNIFNWLSQDDQLLDIPARTAPDMQLNLSSAMTIAIASSFLLGIPLLLLSAGMLIWWQRKRS